MLRSEVVARLTAALGLRAEQRDRVAEHLHDLETGALPPRGVSRRVIDALDGILSGIGAALERTRLIEPPPKCSPRRHSLGTRRRRSRRPMSMPEPDAEVDALFLGREDAYLGARRRRVLGQPEVEEAPRRCLR